MRLRFGQGDHSVHIPDPDVGPSAWDQVAGDFRLAKAAMILVADQAIR
jgi:hypothetical protein